MKMLGLMIVVVVAGGVAGCETVKGVGKDITNASETVQSKF
jgi:predicted small secreted protein